MKFLKIIIMTLLFMAVVTFVQAQQSEFQGIWIGEKNQSAYKIEIIGNKWQEFYENEIEGAGTAKFSAGRAELLLADGRLRWELSLLAPGLIEQLGSRRYGLRFRRQTAGQKIDEVIDELMTDTYIPMHQLSSPPQFDAKEIATDLVYPSAALRSGIEGRVILELFVDRTGIVQRVTILREDPEGRGFGEAAVKAFTGRKGIPAVANGEAVSARYRYPVTFRKK